MHRVNHAPARNRKAPVESSVPVPAKKNRGNRTANRNPVPPVLPQTFRVEHVAEALRKGAGITSIAAAALGCTAMTVRNYLKRYPELREVVEEAVEDTLDLAESTLIAAIDTGDFNAVRFYLETKGKHRGFTRRTEVTGPGGQPIEVTDARDRLLAELAQMGQRLAATHEPRSITNGAARPEDPEGTGAGVKPVLQ
jgi:hypothetical protein